MLSKSDMFGLPKIKYRNCLQITLARIGSGGFTTPAADSSGDARKQPNGEPWRRRKRSAGPTAREERKARDEAVRHGWGRGRGRVCVPVQVSRARAAWPARPRPQRSRHDADAHRATNRSSTRRARGGLPHARLLLACTVGRAGQRGMGARSVG